MADKKSKSMGRKKTADNDGFFKIRAKGHQLKVPKEPDDEDLKVASGADHLKFQHKKKKKVLSRKEQRKNIRHEKKTKRNEFFHNKGTPNPKIQISEEDQPKESLDSAKDESQLTKKKSGKKRKKKSKPSTRDLEIQRLNEENKKEEKEIKKLEKFLNMNNKKKLPSQFIADGLDYLLEVCDHDRFDKREGDDDSEEELEDKYSKALSRDKKAKKEKSTATKKQKVDVGIISDGNENGQHDDINNIDDESDEEGFDKDDSDNAEYSDVGDDDDNDDNDDDDEKDDEDFRDDNSDDNDVVDEDDDDLIGDDIRDDNDNDECDDDDDDDNDAYVTDDDDEDNTPSKKPRMEITEKQPDNSTTKYIPPHLRNKDGNDERLTRLRRQLKGLLNKLSEGNLQFVCNEVEGLFSHNSRNDMNELLTKVILDSCISPSLMPTKLLMEHCLLIAVLNSNIGMEIGAHFIQTLASQFDSLYSNNRKDGKEIFNIVSLFSHLYNFKVIHCGLIYDIIRLLAEGFQEQDIDMLLLILKSTGAEIRRDNPGSLKDIILELQAKAASASDVSNDSRVRFMLEIIANLRNNNLRKIPGYDPSQVEHLRKLLRSVIRSTGGSSRAQLQISLKDLLQADSKGRWWIVGSAWDGRNEIEAVSTPSKQWSSQLLELARKQRMNTDVRRNVFCVMMTSEDYVDAFEKLLKLKLKDVQAREIVHVLLDCCLKEKSYNPFYSFLGQKFCEYNRSYQVTFQFSFWDKFKIMDSLKPNSLNNMSLLLCHLVASKALSLSVLKSVNFMEIEKPSIRFFKLFFTHLFTEYSNDIVRKSFERIVAVSELSNLRQGIAIFIRHFMLNKKEQEKHNDRIRDIIALLQAAKDSRI